MGDLTCRPAHIPHQGHLVPAPLALAQVSVELTLPILVQLAIRQAVQFPEARV